MTAELYENWEKIVDGAHYVAKETVKRYLDPTGDYAEIGVLARWMIGSGVMPYEYLVVPESRQALTAHGMARVLNRMASAVYANGGIAFVTINDAPKIVFADTNSEDFIDLIIDKVKEDNLTANTAPTISVLNIDANSFPEYYDKWASDALLRIFIAEFAAAQDSAIPELVEYYSTNRLWQDSFLELAIEKYKG